ncbi:MAG: hypothetical protein NVS1B11_37720 [Terriglobales bacterium]
MDLKTLEKDLAGNVTHLREDLVADIKAEAVHIADPAECGNIVRRHFDGLTTTLLLFVALFIGAAAFGIFLYTHR